MPRAWNPKGKPHTADAGLTHQRVNVVGVLDYATGEVWHEVHTQSIRRQAVVELIDRLAQREQQMPLTIVVLDNAAIHHGIDPEKLDDGLVNHRLVLMHLPPYSPELNPIEIVWKQAKYHWRRFATWTKEQLLEAVHNLMASIGSTYKISFTWRGTGRAGRSRLYAQGPQFGGGTSGRRAGLGVSVQAQEGRGLAGGTSPLQPHAGPFASRGRASVPDRQAPIRLYPSALVCPRQSLLHPEGVEADLGRHPSCVLENPGAKGENGPTGAASRRKSDDFSATHPID